MIKLNVKEKEDRDILITCGNGTTVKTNKTVLCNIRLDGTGTLNEVKTELYVVKELSTDLILGQEFLFRNKIILDYQNKIILWKKNVINMTEDNEEIEVLERLFYQKMFFLEHKYLEERIKEYEEENQNHDYIKMPPVKFTFSEKMELKQELYYSVSRQMRRDAEEEINRLLKNDIIEKSIESYSSPAFFLKKKNGKLRLVVDYREFNKFIIDDINVIPKLEDILYEVGVDAITVRCIILGHPYFLKKVCNF